jgi:uncharacterized protein YecT (DUF1311 family)
MIMRLLFLSVCLALPLTLSASAASESEKNCGDLHFQADMNDCFGRQWDRADAKLNKVYSAVIAKLSNDPGAIAALRTSERSWLKFRDDNCGFESYGVVGGSMHPMALSICLASTTEARIKELEYQLHCDGSDTSCISPSISKSNR